MKKLFKFLMIVLVWLVIATVAVGAAIALEQPIGTALTFLGILFGAWILFLVVRKLIARRRAKKRAENLVNVESVADDGAQGAGGWLGWLDWRPRTSLERRFRRLRQLLARSRLREQGDPLYVLPWYMLVGHDQSGKTDLVANAGLSLPTLDDPALRTPEDSLDWWLYNEGIVLDTPGSYIGVDEDSPRHEDWPALIRILAEGRIREPLNGIVVTVSYERLQGNADALFDYGRLVRKRVDELMRGVKLHLPIYVVVTKCDQMSGFTAWCENLPSDALNQPMGLLNTSHHAANESAESFVRDALNSVSDRVGRLMLVLVNERKPDPDLLRLPQTVDALKGPLTTFADGLFQATTFEESPRFQGLYMTGRERGDDNARQAFARDLFTRVLPANRRVSSTLSGAERAERHTRRLVLSGWGVAVISVLAILVSTWISHKTYLTETAEQYAGEFGQSESIVERIDRMHTLRTMVDDVDRETASWLMPWFGLPGASQPGFVQELQEIYYERTRKQVLHPLDERFDRALEDGMEQIREDDLDDDEIAFLIGSLIERINVLAAYVDGERGQALHEYPGPYDNSGVYFPDTVDPLTVERVNGLYKQALIWARDSAYARDSLSHRRDQLVEMLNATGERMTWLIPWANDRVAGAGFRLDDFWDGTGRVDDPPAVRAAFTINGYEAIQDFLEQIWWAGVDEERFTRLEEAFQEYYRGEYLREWERFATEFDRGTELLNGRDDWLQAVNSMATPRNPHFHLLEVMYEHLEYFEREDLPDWARMVRFYDEMRSFAPDQEQDHSARNRVLTKLGLKLIKKTGPLGKSLAKSGKRGLKTKKKLDKADARSGTTADERALMLEEAGEVLSAYRGLLEDIAFNSDIRSVSYDATASLFKDPDNPGKGEGPKAQAHQKMRELQTVAGVVTQYNEPFWEVFMGPLDVVSEFYVKESACYVQEEWRNEFLVELEGVPEKRLPEYVLGEGGELWRFLDDTLDPFVERRPAAGYVPTKADGHYIPFEDDFLNFTTVGRERMNASTESHSVRVEALPTSSNGDAVHKPGRTLLQLRCEGGDQDVVNYNFPVSGQFNWDRQCSDTVVEIDIGRYTLTRQWEGELGFAEFLQEFRSGVERYRPEDFPRHQNILEDYGVEYIDVGFRLSGHEPMLAMLRGLPGDPPDDIVGCWN